MPLFHMVSHVALRIVLECQTYATIVFGQLWIFQNILQEIIGSRDFCKTILVSSAITTNINELSLASELFYDKMICVCEEPAEKLQSCHKCHIHK